MGITGSGMYSASAAAQKKDTFVSWINVSSCNWIFYGQGFQQEAVC